MSQDPPPQSLPYRTAGLPRHPESYLKGEQLISYYRQSAEYSQQGLDALQTQLKQPMDPDIMQSAHQLEAHLKIASQDFSDQVQQRRELVAAQQNQRQNLHNQWLQASPEALAQLLQLADRAELASCLENAPLRLIARFLALDPELAQVPPTYPAPIDELTLLWHGLTHP